MSLMYENFNEKRSNNRLTAISTPIMRPPPGTMLLLAAVLVIVSTVQANGKTLHLEPVVDCLYGTYGTMHGKASTLIPLYLTKLFL